jgi:Ni,Fe-hydrogenase III small subunit
VLESADATDASDAWDAIEAWDSEGCDMDVLGMLRPKADLGVKLGILDAPLPQVAAFLLVTNPVATGAWKQQQRQRRSAALHVCALCMRAVTGRVACRRLAATHIVSGLRRHGAPCPSACP